MLRRTLIAIPVLLALLLAAAGSLRAGDTEEKKQELQRIKRELQDKRLKLQRADRRERSIRAGFIWGIQPLVLRASHGQ